MSLHGIIEVVFEVIGKHKKEMMNCVDHFKFFLLTLVIYQKHIFFLTHLNKT